MRTALVMLAAALACGAQTLRELAAKRDFHVGTAVAVRVLPQTEYQSVLAREYNQVEAENEMKFAAVHPARNRYAFEAGDALVEFAQKHGMRVRGHTLVWHQAVPAWLREGEFSNEELSAILHDHIKTAVGHWAGKVAAWDVVNEAFDKDGSLRGSLWSSPGYVERAFRWAREADPEAQLFYNDYDNEAINPKSNAIFAMVEDFKARDVPIDGVGFQMHIKAGADLATFTSNLKRFAALGVKLEITELDVRVPIDAKEADFERQAATYREVFRACLETGGCQAVQTWGFTDAHSWVPRFFKGFDTALPFDRQYRSKPAYRAIQEALGLSR